MSQGPTFSGRGRRRTTRFSVRAADSVSGVLIRVGGIGTIIAVSTVFFFLLSVAGSLFRPARLQGGLSTAPTAVSGGVLDVAVDEYQVLGRTLNDDGNLVLFEAGSGRQLRSEDVTGGRAVTVFSMTPGSELGLLGLADGSAKVVRIGFRTRYLSDLDVPEDLLALKAGESKPFGEGMVERTPEHQFRVQMPFVEMVGERAASASGPVRDLDLVVDQGDLRIAMLVQDESGTARAFWIAAEEKEDFLTGERSLAFEAPVELPLTDGNGPPALVRILGRTRSVLVIWEDGRLVRFQLDRSGGPRVVERADLAPEEPGAVITAAEFLLGRETLMVGDSLGRVSGWFLVRQDGDPGRNGDGLGLVRGKLLGARDLPPVTALAPSMRTRMFLAGFADGSLRVYHATAGTQLAEVRIPGNEPVVRLAMAPKDNGIVAATPSRVARWELDAGYPEATPRTLFLPVWYEGYPAPKHMWQSTGASDDYEPRLGLVPLVFGTIKATMYSMIFGAPIALLAAIYTSEFLRPKVKAGIKPVIELMASLPSVVLGFLAALVFAPFIENVVPAVLAAFMTLPFCVLLGGYLWQLLPRQTGLRLAPYRFLFVLLTVPAGLVLAFVVGPVVEAVVFGGDLLAWLDGLQSAPPLGHPVGGLVFMLLPLSALVVGVWVTLWVNPLLRRASRAVPERWVTLLDLGKFALGCAAAFLLAVAAATALHGLLGWDIRAPLGRIGSIELGSLASTHDQRNALVVGFVMGFAIIPIIYTISEDALSTVPEHLRAASLGAGATPWQTAVRIIIPTAMSGLFSAVMIGLGRAVGETMIVLMALGNTPVMNINIFQGARTLSANIAVELPEAPQGGTLYRTLFLSALVLFAMTFVLNTIAETVRLRFRRRAYQL